MLIISFFFYSQFSKSAKDAASKVQEQSEELGKTEAFKTISSVRSHLCIQFTLSTGTVYSGTSHKRPPLMSGLGGHLWEVVTHEGSFTNSNLTDRGTNQDFG